MAARVGRVRVAVEIVDDDGSTTVHEAIGIPWEHRKPVITLTPSHGEDGVVDLVMVHMDLGLVASPDGGPLFTVEGTPPTTLTITEGRPALDS